MKSEGFGHQELTPVKTGVPCKPIQVSVKTNNVDLFHDDRRLPIPGPYDTMSHMLSGGVSSRRPGFTVISLPTLGTRSTVW